MSLGREEHVPVRRAAHTARAQPLPAGRPGHAVHVDGLHRPEVEVTVDDLLGQPQPLLARLHQAVPLTGAPEVNVLVAELLLQELRELAQSDLIRQQAVEVLRPARSPAGGLKIFLHVDVVQLLLAVQGQPVQTLRVRDADLHFLLQGKDEHEPDLLHLFTNH